MTESISGFGGFFSKFNELQETLKAQNKKIIDLSKQKTVISREAADKIAALTESELVEIELDESECVSHEEVASEIEEMMAREKEMEEFIKDSQIADSIFPKTTPKQKLSKPNLKPFRPQ